MLYFTKLYRKFNGLNMCLMFVMGRTSCAWPSLTFMNHIKAILLKMCWQIRHVFREANGVANCLANRAVQDKFSDFFSIKFFSSKKNRMCWMILRFLFDLIYIKHVIFIIIMIF